MNPIAVKKINKEDDQSVNSTTTRLVNGLKWQWAENLTVLDLSNKQITDLDESVAMPLKLVNLNLSHNKLSFVPAAVLDLSNIECLDLSYNNIKYFDDTPNFYQSIKELDLSYNELLGPPYWVWTESPDQLQKINLSSNTNLTQALTDEYFLELLQYKTLVKEVIIFNCVIRNHLELLNTFSNVKTLDFGTPDLSKFRSNRVTSIPCEGLDQCLVVERLNLSNTHLYSIENDIDIYKNLIEINLSQNNISSIPIKFCCLDNLEVCILSFNNLMYLPDEIVQLKKLTCLKLDSNKLCMVPEELLGLPSLKILDLYDNDLYEVPDDIESLDELDVAMNYLDEPGGPKYMEQRERIRLNVTGRNSGRKQELKTSESEHSPDTSDDEEFLEQLNTVTEDKPTTMENNERASSPEDWDSDDYWVPRYYTYNPTESVWMHFVKSKIREGNFCPIDLHTAPVAEKVRFEKLCNPRQWQIVDGQFNDLSSDES